MIETSNPEIDVDALMRRIREEAARHKGQNSRATAHEVGPGSALRAYPAVKFQPTFHQKPDRIYDLADLLCFHGEQFVDAAYRAILLRAPDSEGLKNYLDRLQRGESKVSILGSLRYSREGRASGVKVRGLLPRSILQRIYQLPLFGHLVQIVPAILRSPDIIRDHRALEMHTITLLEQIERGGEERYRNAQIAFQQLERKIQDAEVKVVALEGKKADQNSVEAALLQKADQNSVEAALLQKADQSSVEAALMRLHELKRNLLDQERRLTLLLEEARKRLPEPIDQGQIEAMLSEEDHLLDAMYATFEDQFRGTREDIKSRQTVYLPIIHKAKAGTEIAPVIDLGCGRGEWLELLRNEGLYAKGIDINRIFLAGCREMDLEVIEKDALTFLREQKPNSVGAITGFHIIEHLPLKYLIALLDESIRVLIPGGVVIFETPNPGNIQVGSCNFYLDPTHRNPLPGPLSQYLLEVRGFVNSRLIYLHPYDSSFQLKVSDLQIGDTINHFFFGPQDYAVIATKI